MRNKINGIQEYSKTLRLSILLFLSITSFFIINYTLPRYCAAQAGSEDFNPDCSKEETAFIGAKALLRTTRMQIQTLKSENETLFNEIGKLRNENIEAKPKLERLRRQLKPLVKKEEKECGKNKNPKTKTQACVFAEGHVDAKNKQITMLLEHIASNDETIQDDRDKRKQNSKIIGKDKEKLPDLEANVPVTESALSECQNRKSK